MNRIEKHIQNYNNAELSKFKAPIERLHNISRATLNRHIKNVARMPTELAYTIAKKLNVSIEKLYNNDK